MKLEEALKHQQNIRHISVELNNAIRGTVNAGMMVNVSVLEHVELGDNGNIPHIVTEVTINPQDID